MQITDRRFEAPRDPQSVLEIVDWAFRAGLGAVRPRPDGDICKPNKHCPLYVEERPFPIALRSGPLDPCATSRPRRVFRSLLLHSRPNSPRRQFAGDMPTARLNSRLKWYTSQKPQVSAICASGASLLTISD